jgi:hypothetical protein
MKLKVSSMEPMSISWPVVEDPFEGEGLRTEGKENREFLEKIKKTIGGICVENSEHFEDTMINLQVEEIKK